MASDHPYQDDFAAPQGDLLTELAASIKETVIETCAKVADIHRRANPVDTFDHGHNHACAHIAAKIRALSSKKKARDDA